MPDQTRYADLEALKIFKEEYDIKIDEKFDAIPDYVIRNIEDVTKIAEKTTMVGFYFYLNNPLPNGLYYYDRYQYDKVLYAVIINAEGTAVDKQFNIGTPYLLDISSDEENVNICAHYAGGITFYSYDIANKTYTVENKEYNVKQIDKKFSDLNTSIAEQFAEKAELSHTHDDRYYTETEVDGLFSNVNTSIDNIKSGSTPVQEATHSSTADTATTAESATKATQDAEGNVIVETYETKEDASAKLDEAKAYTDQVKSDIYGGIPNSTLDTLTELATAFEENQDVVEALNSAITTKADKTDIVQSDWSVNDETQLDYIKMRTHWIEKGGKIILQETVVAIGNDGLGELSYSCNIEDGRPYVVSYNGKPYKVTAKEMNSGGSNGLLLGNSYQVNGIDTGEPFALGYSPDVSAFLVILMDGTVSTDVTFSITTDDYVHTLDNKYLDIIESNGEDVLSWNGDTTGLQYSGVFYKISDKIPSYNELMTGGVAIRKNRTDGTEQEVVFASENIQSEDYNSYYAIVFDNLPYVVFCLVDGYLENMTKGTYIVYSNALIDYVSKLKINNYSFKIKKVKEEYIPPIPEECLPDGVPQVETAEVGQYIIVEEVDENGKPTKWEAVDPWVIESSTAGSTKKFKLTVDDSGTISTTEVTE